MKRALAFMLAALLFLCAACAAPPAPPAAAAAVPLEEQVEAQARWQSALDYVVANAVPVTQLASGGAGQTGLGGYQVVLMGEHHATAGNYTAQLETLRYLNSAYGFTHLIMEFGTADAWLLNRYFETGDEAIAETLVRGARGTSGGSRECVAFYKNLYALNQTLPAAQRLRAFAGDLQHSVASAAYALYLMQPPAPAPNAIAHEVALLARHANLGNRFGRFAASFARHPAEYEAWLGPAAYKMYGEILEQLRWRDEYYGGGGEVYREGRMIALFEAAFAGAPEARWAGIYGSAHTQLNGAVWGTGQGQNLGNHLMHTAAGTKGRMAAITFCYYNCAYMGHDGAPAPMQPNFPFLNPVFDTLPADVCLCPLAGDGSPFGPPGSQPLENQQYLMLLRNSPAVTMVA